MDLRKEMREHKVRTLKTFVLCLLFVGLGIYGATPGVTLLDLKTLTNTTLSEVAKILPARSGGYATGALISGFITSFIDHQICLMLSLIISIATFSALPYFQSINVMYVIIFFAGLSAGVIDTVGNVYTIFLWRKKAAPFIQIVHFAFGLGAFISPMIANPFLLEATDEIQEFGRDLSNEYKTLKNLTEVLTEVGISSLKDMKHDHGNHTDNRPQLTAADLKVHWAYIIISIFNLAVLIFFMIVYYFRPVTTEYPNDSTESTPEKEKKKLAKEASIQNSYNQSIKSNQLEKSSQLEKSTHLEKSSQSTPFDEFNLIKPLKPGMKLLIIVLSVLFFHLYCGLEISFGSLLSPFAVKSNLRMSKSEGSFITAVYWGMFTFFRIFSLFAITYFSPRAVLIFNMALIVLSNGFLLPLANTYRWALWVGSALMGLGCSSVFATMFAVVEQLTPVTPAFTSITMIACCLGEFIIPLLVGFWIDTEPKVFLYIIFVYSLLSLIVLIAIFCIQNHILKKQRAKYLK